MHHLYQPVKIVGSWKQILGGGGFLVDLTQ